MLHHVAILYHPRRKQAVSVAERLAVELHGVNVSSTLGNAWDPGLVAEVGPISDLLVALGGDGTIIQVARIAAPVGVPLLGINLGRVGFLAELTPQSLPDNVRCIAEERFWIEERTMLDVRMEGSAAWESVLCLNEVAVARGASPRAVHIKTCLDGDDFLTYTADGVLVATATGSTAYSLAAGGPILYPESRDMLLTPVAPHLHIGRSIILSGERRVSLALDSDRAAVVTVDGSEETVLEPGRAVEVSRSETVARFARVAPRRYFYTAIGDRLR